VSGEATVRMQSTTTTGTAAVTATASGLTQGSVDIITQVSPAAKVGVGCNPGEVMLAYNQETGGLVQDNPITITANLLDSGDNPVISGTKDINLMIYDPQGNLKVDISSPTVNGTATFENIIVDAPGFYNVTGSAEGLTAGEGEFAALLDYKEPAIVSVQSGAGYGEVGVDLQGYTFDENVTINITERDDLQAGVEEIEAGVRLIQGTIYEFSVLNRTKTEVMDFGKSATISIPYPDTEEPYGLVDGSEIRESELIMYWYNENSSGWEKQTSFWINESENGVSLEVEHFSIYCLGGKLPGSLEIDYLINYPNPFSGGTTFVYNLRDEADEVVIRVYTISGRLIKEIDLGSRSYGKREYYWDGNDDGGEEIASGVYLYKIVAVQYNEGGTDRTATKTGKAVKINK